MTCLHHVTLKGIERDLHTLEQALVLIEGYSLPVAITHLRARRSEVERMLKGKDRPRCSVHGDGVTGGQFCCVHNPKGATDVRPPSA